MTKSKSNIESLNQIARGTLVGAMLVFLVGCEEPFVAEFEPNMTYAHKMQLASGQPMDQALEESTLAMRRMFGTPDDPKLPEFIEGDKDLESLVSMDRLMAASGPPNEPGRGLYRKLCSECHGVTGNGRGRTAALLDPYPRDYRMGKFKFKSTPRGKKPLREDIAYAIKLGIAGTPMKPIAELTTEDVTEEDIQALTDYVIYLSWRGEVERALLEESEFLAFDEGEHLYDPNLVSRFLRSYEDDVDPESLGGEEVQKLYKSFTDGWGFLEDTVVGIAEDWLDAEDSVKPVPEPNDVVVGETIEEVTAAAHSESDSPLRQSIERGAKLFVSEAAGCAKCHGKQGRGDGTNTDFDDWAKDWAPHWTKRAAMDPKAAEDQSELVPLIARGALPPRNIVPRDFREGYFRGGSEPERLYRRIAEGIDGTPMPAAQLKPDQIWDLVNFVRSLRVAPEPTQAL